ncbi:hypothetical protein Emag_005863 [Eimeria magna]
MSLPSSSPFPEDGEGVGGFLQTPPSPASPALSSVRGVAPFRRRGVSPLVLHHVAGLLAAAALLFFIGLCVRKLAKGKAEGVSRRLAGYGGASGGGDFCEGAGPSGAPGKDSDDEGEAGPSPVTQARNVKRESVQTLDALCALIDEGFELLAEETHPNLAITPAGRMLNGIYRSLEQRIDPDEQARALHSSLLSREERAEWQEALDRAREKAITARALAGLGWYDGKPTQPGMPENLQLVLMAQKGMMELRRTLEHFVRGYPERAEERKGPLLDARAAAKVAAQQLMQNQQALASQVLINRVAREKRQKLEKVLKDAENVIFCYEVPLPLGGFVPGTDALLIRGVEAFTDAVPVVLKLFFDQRCSVDINAVASWGLRYKQLYKELQKRVNALSERPESMYAHDQGPAMEALERGKVVFATVQTVIDEHGTVVD